MRTHVASTSLTAYRDLQAGNHLSPQEQRVIACIEQHGPLTRDEIAERTGLRLSAVCGRVKALVDNGKLIERGTRDNPSSGKPNKLVRIAAGQLGLFS